MKCTTGSVEPHGQAPVVVMRRVEMHWQNPGHVPMVALMLVETQGREVHGCDVACYDTAANKGDVTHGGATWLKRRGREAVWSYDCGGADCVGKNHERVRL